MTKPKVQTETLATRLERCSLPGEQWLPIPSYESTYHVSNRGRVYSTPRATTPGGLLKVGGDTYGYPKVALVQNGKQKNAKVHVLVMLAFVGKPPAGMEIRHLDGSRVPHLSNLAYGTHKENGEDSAKHGVNRRWLKPACKWGHAFDAANTLMTPKRRQCRACALARYYAKKVA